MERLTFEGNFCEIAQCAEIPGGSFCEDGACSQKKVWQRLKAYEDTGLTPEEFRAYSSFIEDWIGDQKASEALSYLRSLVQADRAKEIVKVVRCGGCRFSRPLNRENREEDEFIEDCIWCWKIQDGRLPDDFCSDGARRGDNG